MIYVFVLSYFNN